MLLIFLGLFSRERSLWACFLLKVLNLIDQVEAAGVGKVRHKNLVNLIGCCAEGDERLLVAEYMPNDTLSKHLFHCMTQLNHFFFFSQKEKIITSFFCLFFFGKFTPKVCFLPPL